MSDEQIELTTEDGHLVFTRVYDWELNLVGSTTLPKPGYHFGGHRTDCRCEVCRPDIVRLPQPPVA